MGNTLQRGKAAGDRTCVGVSTNSFDRDKQNTPAEGARQIALDGRGDGGGITERGRS